jgi:Fe-S-cluster containining protein
MVGEPDRRRRLVAAVAALYEWLEEQLRQDPDRAGQCQACGACCDFAAYDHRLFITPPELVFLAARLNTTELEPMPSGRCPYQQEGRCTVHQHRFAGCRIFCCRGKADFQNDLSETVLRRLKTLCKEFEIPYRYQDLATALGACADE